MPEFSSTYLDRDGRPRLRNSIVAFCDILGFSHATVSSVTVEESQLLLDKIVSAIDESRDFVRQSFAGIQGAPQGPWGLKFFSDNLTLGYPCDAEGDESAPAAWFIVRCVQRYQLKMSVSGFFLRGGLTRGPLCITDDVIFGAALIECYQLESKASIVPRVILAEPLAQIIRDSLRLGADELPRGAAEAICRDVDGWWFVNYLQAAIDERGIQWELIDRHKASILDSLSHTTRHDVLPKFGWACRYHNLFCHWHRHDPDYSDQFRIDRADENSTMFRLSDTIEPTP